MLLKKWIFSLLFIFSQITVVKQAQADIPGLPYPAAAGGGVSAGAGAGFYGGASISAQAAYGLAGSGYWGGQQACPYRVRTSAAAVSMSDEEKVEQQAIAKLKSENKLKTFERDRAQIKIDSLLLKIEKYFAPEVYEFIVSVHIDGTKECKDYRSYPDYKCPDYLISAGVAKKDGESSDKATIKTCEGKSEVPLVLKDKWITDDGTSYCTANSTSSRGSISSTICSDEKLRPKDAPKGARYSATECSKSLAEYRKTRIEYENAEAKLQSNEEEINSRILAAAHASKRAKLELELRQKNQLESDCPGCDALDRTGGYQKPQRDWVSTTANVLGGLALIGYGRGADRSAQEYNAQLGFPSTNSYGYPFVTAGVYSVINGIAGPGAYGCAGGVGGAGFPFGAGGAYGANGNLGYGPNGALGGAFGYPQGMFGSPWGGGMYQPGFGPGGVMAGPNGGWPNGQFGGGPLNGQIGGAGALCITWPCTPGLGGGAQIGIPANGWQGAGGWQGVGGVGQIGIPANGWQGAGGWQGVGGIGQIGIPANGGLGSYMNNPQYQMQLMQQQQAMLQQQMQQQQQLQQYYQAQAQAQMQQYQRQMQVQQQAAQVQQEIYSLQMRLQMLVSGAYSGSSNLYGGGGLYGGVSGGFNGGIGLMGGTAISGGIYFGAATAGSFNGGAGVNPILPGGGTATVPGVGTGTRGR